MKSFFIVILLEDGRYVQATGRTWETHRAWDTREAASVYMEGISPLYRPRVVEIISAPGEDD